MIGQLSKCITPIISIRFIYKLLEKVLLLDKAQLQLGNRLD